jgi:transposase
LIIKDYQLNIEQKNNTSNKVISIDPGIKTFLTGITNVSVYKFGNNLCDTIKKDLNKNLNKRRKQLIKVASERIKNRIIDMHWKCINHIINKSKVGTIILGNWSTKITKSKI